MEYMQETAERQRICGQCGGKIHGGQVHFRSYYTGYNNHTQWHNYCIKCIGKKVQEDIKELERLLSRIVVKPKKEVCDGVKGR
jgi:hypothetical protein